MDIYLEMPLDNYVFLTKGKILMTWMIMRQNVDQLMLKHARWPWAMLNSNPTNVRINVLIGGRF